MDPVKLICIDCDSTLSGIEGIDELARRRGPECHAAVERMTRDAMDGRIPLDQVFARRLEIIRPTRDELDDLGRQYVKHVEPTAGRTIAQLKAAGWMPVVLSAGYTRAIEPLASLVGIRRIEAVRLEFDGAGNYAGFDGSFPATRNGGKPACIAALKRELQPVRTVMVGDGVSDLEALDEVDLFVGFGRYVERVQVRARAHFFIHSLAELPAILS